MASPLAGLPGGYEVWIILVIILLLFGRRIPQVARSLGQGISQFKKGLSEPDADIEAQAKAEDEKAAKTLKGEGGEAAAGSGEED